MRHQRRRTRTAILHRSKATVVHPDGQRQMRADEFIRLCVVMNVDMGFFLTSEMREELSYRRKKVIEDYGSGLCGLLPQSRRGEELCTR